jgi:hypothetical protein
MKQEGKKFPCGRKPGEFGNTREAKSEGGYEFEEELE